MATAFATTTAQAADAPEVKTAKAASCASGSEAEWVVPGRSASTWTGKVWFHDYNEHSEADQDNFMLADRAPDGHSASLWVKNNHTGKTYYKHVYSGSYYCLGVGNIPNGKTASWKACGWDNGKILACKTGTVIE